MVGRDNGAIVAYETLRSEIIQQRPSGAQSHALALFLRQGMIAWMTAWTQCHAARSVADSARRCVERPAVVAHDAAAQVVQVLTEMVLGQACRGGGGG